MGEFLKPILIRFISPILISLPFLQSLYVCPFVIPWIVCDECEILPCLMNPRTTPIRWILISSIVFTSLAFGRVFCGWVCSYGAMQEIVGRAAKKRLKLPSHRAFLAAKSGLAAFTIMIAATMLHPIIAMRSLLSGASLQYVENLFSPWLNSLGLPTSTHRSCIPLKGVAFPPLPLSRSPSPPMV